MKKLILWCWLIVGGVRGAAAFTYTNTDLLLIFRKDGFNDVEFNLGSVSNFLGQATSTQIAVTNWDQGLVRGNFNNSLAGVSATLQAATATDDTPRRVWLTSGSATTAPTDVSGSKWGQLRSKIDFVGVQAQTITDANATPSYVVSAYAASSYTQIASSGGSLDVVTISGLAPFPVEAAIPTKLRLFEIKANNANPKPLAALVGTFDLSADGSLQFTAGSDVVAPPPQPPSAPQILGITRAADLSTVSFTTTNGATYRLRFASASGLGSARTNWTALSATLAGTGANASLTDQTSDADRFYAVEITR